MAEGAGDFIDDLRRIVVDTLLACQHCGRAEAELMAARIAASVSGLYAGEEPYVRASAGRDKRDEKLVQDIAAGIPLAQAASSAGVSTRRARQIASRRRVGLGREEWVLR